MDNHIVAGKRSFYFKYGKRALDLVCSAGMLILLSPLLAVTCALVRIKHGKPVFFTPTRPGRNEKIFRIYKFRTMTNARDKNGELLPEKYRTTKLGSFLRKTSLDELPELINIVRGDMSFVGPRPLGKNQLPYYSDRHRNRFLVRPGLTGLAQINGRNGLEWNRRFNFDLEYIENLSLLGDLKILVGTFLKVTKGADVTVPGSTGLKTFLVQRTIETEGYVQPVGENGRRAEIGGQFALPEISKDTPKRFEEKSGVCFPAAADQTYTFSGRFALQLALRDIAASRKIKKAYLPSFCAFGMVQPFVDEGIRYEFYNVRWDGTRFVYGLENVRDCDVLLIMSYFSTGTEQTDHWIREFRDRNCVVIEDLTHSLLTDRPDIAAADYYFASLRKWFPTASGGWLGKTSGSLSVRPDLDADGVVAYKLDSMREKAAYLRGDRDQKADILEKEANFEGSMVVESCTLKMDSTSKDILQMQDPDAVRNKRIANARRLFERLAGLEGLTFLNDPRDWDTAGPLYVPVLLENEKRNALKQYMEEHGVFCPVSWPERMGAGDDGFRKEELSLICDQRYDPEDMDLIADLVVSFLEKEKAEAGVLL